MDEVTAIFLLYSTVLETSPYYDLYTVARVKIKLLYYTILYYTINTLLQSVKIFLHRKYIRYIHKPRRVTNSPLHVLHIGI